MAPVPMTPNFFALQLKANEAVFCAALSHNVVAGNHPAVQRDYHAEYQVGHGCGGVAGAVAHEDMVCFAGIHGDVVDAGEGHGEHF